MVIKEARVMQDFVNGNLKGEHVQTYKKVYQDIASVYAKEDTSLPKDTLMYQVYSYSEEDPAIKGNLNWGLTVMEPVLVNGECNVTRGHFHKDMSCMEVYFCLKGEGLLLLMDESGECYAEKMSVGTVHHIDGRLAHRLVNTGDEQLHVGACWPTNAGHDYEKVEKMPFSVRIFKENGEIKVR